MSYELRTPLTTIAGFAEMMSAGYAGELSASAKEYVDGILQSTNRLSMLIDNVLELTQGEAGMLPVDKAPVDLAVEARDAVAWIKGKATADGLDVALRVTARPGLHRGTRNS